MQLDCFFRTKTVMCGQFIGSYLATNGLVIKRSRVRVGVTFVIMLMIRGKVCYFYDASTIESSHRHIVGISSGSLTALTYLSNQWHLKSR